MCSPSFRLRKAPEGESLSTGSLSTGSLAADSGRRGWLLVPVSIPGAILIFLVLAQVVSAHSPLRAQVVREAKSPLAAAVQKADSTERSLLVTFVQRSPRAPRAAGSSSGNPYVGGRYTASSRVRRTAAKLARSHGLQRGEGWPIRALGLYCVVLDVPDGREVAVVIRDLELDPRVESVQRLQRFRVLGGLSKAAPSRSDGATRVASPSDPYSEMQHSLTDMKVWDAHRWSGGRGVTVAVVDTGVDQNHVDLKQGVRVSKDFVDRRADAAELHGTAVAGVIGARAGNGVGTVGVAPESRLMVLRACWEEESDQASAGVCDSFTLAKALAFVVDERPDVLNLSLAGPQDPLLDRLLKAAIKRGVLVVAAHRDSGVPEFPASSAGVVVVQSQAGGAAGEDVLRASGTEVLAAAPGDRFDFVSGSSFAAAHVSGVLALLLERLGQVDPETLANVLRETSRFVLAEDGTRARLVDACAALRHLDRTVRCG